MKVYYPCDSYQSIFILKPIFDTNENKVIKIFDVNTSKIVKCEVTIEDIECYNYLDTIKISGNGKYLCVIQKKNKQYDKISL